MTEYRQLTEKEINQLELRGCTSESWSDIMVSRSFNTKNLFAVQFSGKCKIGEQGKEIVLEGNVPKTCGIYYTHLHNTTIGDNVYINRIRNYIANYKIGDNVIIENTNQLVVSEKTSFGYGLRVNVLDETGGRNVLMHDKLSAHEAYIMAYYKHCRLMLSNLEELITNYCKEISSDIGIIGNNTQIINCGDIRNVRIGEYAKIQSASILENGTVHSNYNAKTLIGHSVSLRGFIIATGATIKEGALVKNSFVGQGCELGAQYSAENSLFFANCQGFHGEACSVFAGPYTVTHHKSTLLIAGMYSFLNAGSGSNQSNHMYKLGPIHHGIVERGSKTTSDSYILWPAKIGAFTLIMGRHTKHSDTSNIPFSYLIENNNETWLVPGVNIRSVGTIRDALKWPKRDKRTDKDKLDSINFNLLSPFTIQKMHLAIETLTMIEKISGKSSDVFSYNNTKIKSSSMHKGLKLYKMAIVKFLGNSIITRLNKMELKKIADVAKCLEPQTEIGKGEWLDIAGVIVPKSEIDKLILMIENNKINKQSQIADYFKNLHENYYEYEWTWTEEFFKKYTGKDISKLSVKDIINFVEEWRCAVIELDNMLLEDAKKEFTGELMTGFGVDGDSTIIEDFRTVRGNFEDNNFAKEILSHIDRKNRLAQRVIEQLSLTN